MFNVCFVFVAGVTEKMEVIQIVSPTFCNWGNVIHLYFTGRILPTPIVSTLSAGYLLFEYHFSVLPELVRIGHTQFYPMGCGGGKAV